MSAGRSEQTKRKALSDGEPYELYQRGVEEHDKLTQDGNAEAIRLLSHAVELDPDLAVAWTALAFAHCVAELYGFTEDRTAANREWRECAKRALALNPSDPKAHVTMGDIQARAGDLSAAKGEYADGSRGRAQPCGRAGPCGREFCPRCGGSRAGRQLVASGDTPKPGWAGFGSTEVVQPNARSCRVRVW